MTGSQDRRDEFGDVLLLSASLMRLGKWSDKVSDRLTWENTFLGDVLLKQELLTDKKFEETLRKNGLNMLKFGSWTRKAPAIPKLVNLYKK